MTQFDHPARHPTRALAAALMLAAGSILCVPAAQAQGSPTQSPSTQVQPTPTPLQQQADIPDQKLDAAAAAIRQVASIKQDYQRKLDSAAPSDQERIATEANDALQKAVTDQGLSVDEYSTILEVAQNDPQVRQKIVQRLGQGSAQ